jgi:adenosine deaminase
MCPTSNLQTKALKDMTKFPFMDYLNNGINVTLNTDDMAIERTTLAKEFEYMEKNFGLNSEQEKKILMNSINAAFTTDDVKRELRKKINFGCFNFLC